MSEVKTKIVSIKDTDIYEKLELFAGKVFATTHAEKVAKRSDMLFEVAYHVLAELKDVHHVAVYSSQFVESYIAIEDDKLAWHINPGLVPSVKDDKKVLAFSETISPKYAFDITGEYARIWLTRFEDYAKHTKAAEDGIEILNSISTCFVFGAFAQCIYEYAIENLSEGDVLRINEEHFNIDLKVEGGFANKLVGYYEINK